MKRKITLLLGMALMISGMLMGCGGSGDKASGGQEMTTQQKQEEQMNQTQREVKTGLAMIADVSGSKDAGEDHGQTQAKVTMAAVTVDEAGRIVACRIDEAQMEIDFGKDGKILTDIAAEISTKRELGDNYGMKKASSIGKEWYEQADAFAKFCVGKTADEVKGIAVTEYETPADTDLASSCSISIGDFKEAVVKAVNNAE